MSFVVGNILQKILSAFPSTKNPAVVRGITSKWRDDFAGDALNLNSWEVDQQGTGQTIAVSNSELRVSTGIIANSQTIIRNKNKFNLPCRVSFIFYLSQRIANQEFYFEIINSSGQHYARFLLNGTNASIGTPQVANSGDAGTSSIVNIGATNNYTSLEIDIGIDEIKFASRLVDAGGARITNFARNRKLPDPNLEYFIQIRAVNLNPAPISSTTLFFDSISYQSLELLSTEIVGSRGSLSASDSILVTNGNLALGVSGAVSITDSGLFNLETITNLAANGIFTGTTRDTAARASAQISVLCNQPGILYIDQSPDGSFWIDNYPERSCPSGINTFFLVPGLRFFRLRYVNGGVATTNFRIYTTQRVSL